VESFISIAVKQTTPFNASTAFFCGDDKSELVRSYASWIGNQYISTPDVEIKGLREWKGTT